MQHRSFVETHVAKRAARDTPAAGWVGARFGVVGEGLEACGLVAWVAQSSLRDGLAHSEDSKASIIPRLEAAARAPPPLGGGRGPCEGEEARVVQQRTMDNEA